MPESSGRELSHHIVLDKRQRVKITVEGVYTVRDNDVSKFLQQSLFAREIKKKIKVRFQGERASSNYLLLKAIHGIVR